MDEIEEKRIIEMIDTKHPHVSTVRFMRMLSWDMSNHMTHLKLELVSTHPILKYIRQYRVHCVSILRMFRKRHVEWAVYDYDKDVKINRKTKAQYLSYGGLLRVKLLNRDMDCVIKSIHAMEDHVYLDKRVSMIAETRKKIDEECEKSIAIHKDIGDMLAGTTCKDVAGIIMGYAGLSSVIPRP